MNKGSAFSIAFKSFCFFLSVLCLHARFMPLSFAAGKEKTAAIIISFRGDLTVKRRSALRYARAKKGDFLYEGDTVKSGKNTVAAITLVTGIQIKINANTEFVIN